MDTFIKPPPRYTGVSRNVLRCSMTGCPFYCRSYVSYDDHLERRHFCLDCKLYCSELHRHTCPQIGEQLGNVDAGHSIRLEDFAEYSRSHGGSMISYKYRHDLHVPDIETTFLQVQDATVKLLEDLYTIHSLSKVEICMGIMMGKEVLDEDGRISHKEQLFYFKSHYYELQSIASINSILLDCASDIIQKKNTFLENGSGWYLVAVESFSLKLGEVRLFMNSRASGYLPMPMKNRQGFVNFQNKDDNCFQYCIASGLFWNEQVKENEKRGTTRSNLSKHTTWKKYFPRINFTGTDGSVNIYNDLPLFEDKNNIAVNVLTHHKDEVVMMRSSKCKSSTIINLFMIHQKDGSKTKYHLALIRDLNKFLRNKRIHKLCFCIRCFPNLKTEAKLQEHMNVCGTEEVKQKLPKERENLKFTRPELTIPYPFILYWDFETFSTKPENSKMGKCTTINNEFIPASYSLCIVENDGIKPKVIACEYYDGENPVDHFFGRVFDWAEKLLFNIRKTNNLLKPTPEELHRHHNASQCEFCKRKFTTYEEGEEKKKPVVKTFHHCHRSGRFLHSLCASCNLKIKYKNELLCIAHNGSGFDFLLLMQHLDSPIFEPRDINVISKGSEKFVQVDITATDMYIPPLNSEYNQAPFEDGSGWRGNRKVKVRFIDSLQFLPGSLDSLSAALKKENASSFKLVQEALPYMFPCEHGSGKRAKYEDSIDLLLEKLPFPYKYLTDPHVLTDDHPIPGRESFDNDLRKEKCSDADWELVQRVCTEFNITDFRQFTRLYTILDTVLLAVIWENFRANGMEMYGLDPSYMCTGSGYSWQCFLYKTRAEVEYIRDLKMLGLIKDGIRGGTSFCTQKVVTANNERSPLGYDATKERTHIVYNDKVSLYATALLDKYPHSNYAWADNEELESLDWKSYDGKEDTGYILRVSLGYPPDAQDKTQDLPLAPEKRIVKINELSTKQQSIMKKLGSTRVRSFTTQPRLLLHCYDRENYVLHYKALKYYLNNGMTLLKIHEGIKFTEKAYFKDYIQFNIEKRKVAKSESMRTFLKNQNNQIFGKCLQSNKNDATVKFCGSRADSTDLISKPECVDFRSITENISIVLLRPKEVVLNKPIQSGMTVLDLAKVIFYTGYYQELKSVFGDRITNTYMDTDSSVILIRDPQNTFFQDLIDHKHFFDFSKIPKSHEIFQKYSHISDLRDFNAGVSGKWKLESIDIAQIVTVKSKQYSILYFDMVEEMKCKGIPMSTLKSFSHEKYKSVVCNDDIVTMDVNYIISMNHKLFNITVKKIGFHSLDLYRVYPDPNDINFSLPLGHYKLKSWHAVS